MFALIKLDEMVLVKTGFWLLKDGFFNNDNKFNKLFEILNFHRSLFIRDFDSLNLTNVPVEKIELFNQMSKFKDRSILPKKYTDELRKEVKRLVKIGVLNKIKSLEYSSPVKVNLNGKSPKLELNYSNLNETIADLHYQLPETSFVFEIQTSTIFSKISIKDACFQIGMDSYLKHFTGFITEFGNFQFNTLHPNIKNADKVVHLLIEKILSPIYDPKSFRVHFDKILIFSKNFDSHLDILSKILTRLIDSNLKVDVNDCEFGVKELSVFGYHLSSDGISIDPEIINYLQTTTNLMRKIEIEQFISMAEKYHFFASDLNFYFRKISKIKELLVDLNYFTWSKEHQEAFDYIRSSLIFSPSIGFRQRSFTIDELLLDFSKNSSHSTSLCSPFVD